MKKGEIVKIHRKLSPTGYFKSYAQIKKYWQFVVS